jgi:two-component system NtrC family sensor kinase
VVNLVIGNQVSILEDQTNSLSIKEVVDSDAFVLSDVPIPNLQLSKSDFWIRFSIKNESDQEQILLALEYPNA